MSDSVIGMSFDDSLPDISIEPVPPDNSQPDISIVPQSSDNSHNSSSFVSASGPSTVQAKETSMIIPETDEELSDIESSQADPILVDDSDDSIVENSYCESTKSSKDSGSAKSIKRPISACKSFSGHLGVVSSTPTTQKTFSKSNNTHESSKSSNRDIFGSEHHASKSEDRSHSKDDTYTENMEYSRLEKSTCPTEMFEDTEDGGESSDSEADLLQPAKLKTKRLVIDSEDDDMEDSSRDESNRGSKMVTERSFVKSKNRLESSDQDQEVDMSVVDLEDGRIKNKRMDVSNSNPMKLKRNRVDESYGDESVINISSSSDEEMEKDSPSIHDVSLEINKQVKNLSQFSRENKTKMSKLPNYSQCSLDQLQTMLQHKEKILSSTDVSLLPDKGSTLLTEINLLKEEIKSKTENIISDETSSSSEDESEPLPISVKPTPFVPKPVYRYEPPSPEKEVEVIEDVPKKSDPVAELEQRIKIKRNIYQASNLRSLVDGGEKLQKEISALERELMMMKLRAGAAGIISQESSKQYKQMPLEPINLNLGAEISKPKEKTYKEPNIPQHVIDALYASDKNYGARDYGGKISHEREREMVRVTSNVLEGFQSVIKNMPDIENLDPESVTEPSGLRVDLMPHQKRALHWLLWRESQESPGGILADDMGLGKTLTMLSLILRHKQLIESGELKDIASKMIIDDDGVEEENKPHGWMSRSGHQKLKITQGTLIICPASVIGQWEQEIKRRFYSHKLTCLMYHGSNRDTSVSKLCKYDVVLTTYQLAMKEAFGKGGCKVKAKNSDGIPVVFRKDQGSLYQVGWTRIILDEGHIIRNHKSQTAQAMCMLKGARRWAVSGTPVQNKEMDMFSLIRFLRISPFDEYTCWKYQIQNGSAQGRRRLGMVVNAILLRRTKDQTDSYTGKALVTLPEKKTIEHTLSLRQEEREIYDRVFAYSKNSLIEYMKTQEQKEYEKEFKTSKSSTSAPPIDEKAFTPTLNLKGGDANSEVKTHHILVLLLRLRQVCCHPFLIKTIVDEAEQAANAIEMEKHENAEDDLLEKLHNLTVKEFDEIEEETGVKTESKIFSLQNPVFDPAEMSSKIEKLVEELANIKKKGKTNKLGELDPVNGYREKAVIVSQWTSLLKVVHQHLLDCGLKALSIDGTVPVKDRNPIVEEFNNNPKGSKVLLLSLAAGGVGLNLTGANHLFLLDMHWNPQMEKQAFDRVYRVGQTRPVTIHRFIVENTVEEKIYELQKKKLQLAEDVLSGTKTSGNALTLKDLKELFNVA